MCQLIAKRNGVTIPKWALKLCWKKNSDGAGFAYVDGEEIKVVKGFMDDFNKFYEAYSAVEESSQMLIHFRVATHGSKCEGNCHPFLIDKKLVMGHNGVLGFFAPDKDDDRSDTRIFAEDYVAKMWNQLRSNSPKGRLQSMFRFIAPAVAHNKIVFMTLDEFYIFNEKSGDWVDDVWYSNGVPTRSSYSWNSHYGSWEDVEKDGKKTREYVNDPDLVGMPDSFRSGYTSPDPLASTRQQTRSTGSAGTGYAGSGRHFSKGRDDSVTVALEDYTRYKKGEIGESAYYYSMWYMLKSDFEHFLELMCKGQDGKYDHELATLLILDRKEALKRYQTTVTENSYTTGTGTTLHNTSRGAAKTTVVIDNRKKLNYPPWLEQQFKIDGEKQLIYPVDTRFARHLVGVERGFLLDGVIVSRQAAKKVLGFGIECEFPKEKGIFAPVYNPKGKVHDWARIAGPTGAKLGPMRVTSWEEGVYVERKPGNKILSLLTNGKQKPVAGPAN